MELSKEIKVRDVVILKTVVDMHVGFVSEIDEERKMLWISQTESLLNPLYFNYDEITLLEKLT